MEKEILVLKIHKGIWKLISEHQNFRLLTTCLYTKHWIDTTKKLDAKSSIWQHLKKQHS